MHVALTVDKHIRGQGYLPYFKDTENEAQRSWECPKPHRSGALGLYFFCKCTLLPS